MARPKKDKTNGGADAQPSSPPSSGHNALTPEQEQALHLNVHVPLYEKFLAAKKKADADFKAKCKEIKSEGGSIDAIKLTVQLRTPEGEQAFRDQMALHNQVAAWNGLGIQVDMDYGEREPAEDRAYGEGKRAGMKGERASPNYDPSTDQAQAWLRGHADGQAVLSQGFKPLAQAPAEGAAAH